ncbi:MAG: (2Fe-2S) ferredoxin domain-containing protein [Chloroflexota bacterium]
MSAAQATSTGGTTRRPNTAAAVQPPPRLEGRQEAVVLLGKGGYGTTPQEELDRMAAAVRASGRYAPVETAFVDQGTPALPQALQRCVDGGARRILVAPVFVPMDRSLRIWLPHVLRRWLRRRRVSEVELVLAKPLGDRPSLGAAVLETLAAADGARGLSQGVPGDYGNPGWSVIPPYRYQAFFCTGPRCTTRGAGDLQQQLRDRLMERGLASGADKVHVIRTGCLYPCNLGPAMVVYPEGVWYCALTPRAIDRIVSEHFADGQVVQAYTRRPGRRRHTRPEPADPCDPVEDDPPEARRRATAPSP